MLQVWSISYRISMTSSLLYQSYQAILFWIRLSLHSDWHGVWAVFIIIIFIIVIVSVVVMIIIIIIIVVVPIIIIVIILIIIIIIIIIVLLLLLWLSLLLLLLPLFGKWYSIPMRHNLCRSFHPWCPGVKNRCLSDVCGDHRRPQTLAEICRNMDICCGFRAVAARKKYPGLT